MGLERRPSIAERGAELSKSTIVIERKHLRFVAVVVLLSPVLDCEHPTLAALAATIGVLAGLEQVIGLLRWAFLVPALARMDADPMATPEAGDCSYVLHVSQIRWRLDRYPSMRSKLSRRGGRYRFPGPAPPRWLLIGEVAEWSKALAC
jgi:uncharacterized protein DUF4386